MKKKNAVTSSNQAFLEPALDNFCFLNSLEDSSFRQTRAVTSKREKERETETETETERQRDTFFFFFFFMTLKPRVE